VVVVDDEADLRALLRAALPLSGIEVVGEAEDGWAALAEVARSEPDAVVLDLRMPGLDGWDTLRQLRESFPTTGVVLYTAEPGMAVSARAAEFGVKVVGKSDRLSQLAEALLSGPV
jgi:CheY-like chemotaxis protein